MGRNRREKGEWSRWIGSLGDCRSPFVLNRLDRKNRQGGAWRTSETNRSRMACKNVQAARRLVPPYPLSSEWRATRRGLQGS